MAKIRVLLAEDNVFMREILRMLFSNQDDVELVAEAANAREAISEIESKKPDVAVLDFRLPDLEGAALVSMVTKQAPNTRVVVVSALSLRDDVEAALRAGAKAYLAKVGLRRELLACIRAVHAGEPWTTTRYD